MKKIIFMTLFLLVAMTGQSKGKGEFTVLQWNVWQEGTMVPGGYDAIVNEIVRLQPDFVTFSEVRNYHNTRFNERIVASLKEKGLDYYSFYTYDTGLLSKHPITDSLTVFPENGDHGSIYRLTSWQSTPAIWITWIVLTTTYGVMTVPAGKRYLFRLL
jgi:hypothetical protein